MTENINHYDKVVRLFKKFARQHGYELHFDDVDIDLTDDKLFIKGNLKHNNSRNLPEELNEFVGTKTQQ